MNPKVLAGVLAALAFVALLAYMSLGGRKFRVEVCVEYQGRTNCRTAAGPSQQQALRTATDNACATIASGMTDSMSCGQKPPTSIRWLN